MSDKRAKLSQRRKRRRESGERKERRREERITEPLKNEEGRMAIEWLDGFLINYRDNNNPQEFDVALSFIQDFNLLKIADHKYTMTAAVATIYRMHPEYQKEWHKQYPQIIDRAERLYPEPTGLGIVIEKPYQIDQALVDWMVSGDMTQIDAVADLAEDPSDLGAMAENALAYYIEQFPEVRRHLKREKGKTFRKDAVQQKQAEELAELIQCSPVWHKVALVRFWDGDFIVSTMDGSQVGGIPLVWKGLRVVCQKATPLEIASYRTWRDHMEDPV